MSPPMASAREKESGLARLLGSGMLVIIAGGLFCNDVMGRDALLTILTVAVVI